MHHKMDQLALQGDKAAINDLLQKRFNITHGNNFILCIPIRFRRGDYDFIKENVAFLYPNCSTFDYPTLHLSFGYFQIKGQEELRRAKIILEKVRHSAFAQKEIIFDVTMNQFDVIRSCIALVLSDISQEFEEFIQAEFGKHRGFYPSYYPHISVASLPETDFPSLEMSIPRKVSLSVKLEDLQIVLKGPIINQKGEYQYLEI